VASGGKKGGGKSGKGGKPAPGKYSQPVSGKYTQPAATPPATQGMSTAQKVVWYSLHVLVFAVPLAMSNANWLARAIPALATPLTYDQFDIVKVFVMRACVLVGMGAWTFDFFLRGGKLRRTKADWLILVFLGWVLLTSFTSISPATAFFGKYRRFEGFFSFLTYAAAYFLVIQVVDRASRIRSLAATLLVSGGLVSFYGILQYLSLDPVNWGTQLPFEFTRSFSTFGNPDLLGGYLIFPLVIAIPLALSEKRLGWRITYWVIFFLTAVCWITAFVRGAWIGGAVGLLIVAVAAWLARPKFEVTDYVAGGVTAAAGLAVIIRSLSNTNGVLNFAQRFSSIFKFQEGSSLTRFEIWQAAWAATKARPIFGWGADTFRLVFPMYKPAAYTRDAGYISVADNVHDYPLQISSALGIPGLLLLYGTFGWILWLAAPNAFAKGKGADRLVVTGFWAAAVGYIVHLMFGLSVTGSTIFLWVAFAIILSPIARTVDVGAKAWGPAVAVVGLALSAALFVGNAVYIVADNYYLRGQFGMTSTGETPVDLIKTAIALNPYNDMYRSQLGQAYLDQMNGWVQEAQRLQTAGQDPSTALQNAQTSFRAAEAAYKDVMAFVPSEYDNYVFLSALYNQAGTYFDPTLFQKAVAVAKEGERVEPFGPLIRYQEAVALYNQNKLAEAQKVLEAAVPMDPGFVEGRMMLAELYTRQNRPADAARLYREVLLRFPDNTQAKDALAKVEGSSTATGSVNTTP
jgi:O-antigen ligase/TolA-binding protein